jgi:hypothetical protein
MKISLVNTNEKKQCSYWGVERHARPSWLDDEGLEMDVHLL